MKVGNAPRQRQTFSFVQKQWSKSYRTLMVFALAGVSIASSAQQTQVADHATLPDAPTPALAQSSSQPADTTQKPPLTLKKLPLRILTDEVQILTSPAHIRKTDLKWLLPLAGATGVALATDSYTMRNVVSRNSSFNEANSTSSDVLRDAAIAVPVLMFATGSVVKNEHTRETGLLAGEAILDGYIFDAAIKYITLRERPNINNAEGKFFTGSATSDPSFFSGHSVVAWSSAAVLAGEYSKPWQQAGIYALASSVSLTRVLAQQHFPTDALIGSATGWLIGHYVYKTHHRPAENIGRIIH